MHSARLLPMRAFVIIMLLASFRFASAANCPSEMQQRAAASLHAASGGWVSLREHHSMYAGCDDGELAEGYSDAVTQLFANRWALTGRLLRQPRGFQGWAVRHVDASASAESLEEIVRHTRACSGSAGKRRLCKEVRQAAANALATAPLAR